MQKKFQKEDIRQEVNEGWYLQGEEYKGTLSLSYTNKSGKVERVEVEVHGSKIPLLPLQKHLQHHEKKLYAKPYKRARRVCQYGESGCGSTGGKFLLLQELQVRDCPRSS